MNGPNLGKILFLFRNTFRTLQKGAKYYKSVLPEVLGCNMFVHVETGSCSLLEMEKLYQGKWSANMLPDFCWTLKQKIMHFYL